MHRTGTSAITRVLGLLGVDLPRNPIPGIRNDNDRGFWEPIPVNRADDEFLASIGSAWDNVSAIAPSVFVSAKADAFADELGEILRAEYGESPLFVVKDPRLCRLVPVWVAALERFGARPSFIITTRNPLEVAGSLKARNGFSTTKSCLLWLRYLLDAERDSRGFPRVFVSYEHLLRDWVSTTDYIARELNLSLPRSDHETNLQIEEFLSSALRHHSFDYSELSARSDVLDWVKQAFEAISRAATEEREVDSEVLDEIRAELDRADLAYGPLLEEVQSTLTEREALLTQVQSTLTERETTLAETLARLKATEAELDHLESEVARRDELLALALRRGRRRRTFVRFCSWLVPPTATNRGNIKAYLHVRRSNLFDDDFYLSRYPDVLHAGQDPIIHYVEHGRLEGRQPVASPVQSSPLKNPTTTSTRALPPASEPITSASSSSPNGRTRQDGESEVATRDELLARARRPGRRRRTFIRFSSWLVRPTAYRRGYINTYLHLRRSNLFDDDFYLSRYPDVSHAGLDPIVHYIEHGRLEGRSPRSARAPLDGNFAAKVRQALAAHVPQSAMTAVATGGDERLLSLPDCRTCHFPRASDGDYGGTKASGETALIANLEAMRAAGADFLFVPPGQQSLLEGNPRFRAHLGEYSRTLDSPELGVCFRLDSPDPSKAWRRQLAELAELIERESGREASILNWDSGLRLQEELPGCGVFMFTEPLLPHLDESVDVVALVTSSEERLAEAKRVARHAVLEVPADGAPPRLVLSASFVEHTPSVSIIIPCHDQLAHTQSCIRALGETLAASFLGEIIIVDDASDPATVAGLEQLVASDPRLTLLRNEVNQGFLASVNRAVGEATGEFVVLLNNDTIPLPGWLPPLLAPFRARDDVGAVGGRLIYPDGRLQEAGGLVFRDGSAAKFGYGDPEPDFPLFTVPREVDYCSGCLLAFRRDFFLGSGGFDPQYGFGFYEDTDFCFRVRTLNRVVLYEPESVIVHVEGASAGTDLTQGAKRFQTLNASLFTQRWQEALARQPERPERLDREGLQRLSSRTVAIESP